MSSKYFATLTAVVFSLMLLLPLQSNSQVIESTGTAQEAASQLIYYYNLATGDLVEASDIQVTNTNDTTPVTVHVQIFRSFGPPDNPTICDERNFVDFLTPNDTHVYDLAQANFPKNTGEAEGTPGESTSIDLSSPPTEGFVVITPVVSESDLSAIAFPHMVGSTNNIDQFSLNAMGRQAVDLTTGEKPEDGTPLDGETTGFVQLQPQELIFSFETFQDSNVADIAGITFIDVYGEPGLQGYRVDPGSANWTPFIFDWKESVTSCGEREIVCYTNIGLHDDAPHLTQANFGDDLLCSGATTPEFPSTGDLGDFDIGWSRIFVSGVDEKENHLGLYVFDDPTFDAKWMNTNQ